MAMLQIGALSLGRVNIDWRIVMGKSGANLAKNTPAAESDGGLNCGYSSELENVFFK